MIPATTLAGLVDFEAPDPALVTSAAIAHGLGQLNRWCGAAETPLSVAQHSLLVADIHAELFPARRRQRIYPLLHDAHEYLIGDVSRPAEALFDRLCPGFAAAIGLLKARLDGSIRAALGVPEPTAQLLEEVAIADALAADLEWRLRLPAPNGRSPFAATPGAPRRRTLPVLTWASAADAYRAALDAELAARHWEKAA